MAQGYNPIIISESVYKDVGLFLNTPVDKIIPVMSNVCIISSSEVYLRNDLIKFYSDSWSVVYYTDTNGKICIYDPNGYLCQDTSYVNVFQATIVITCFLKFQNKLNNVYRTSKAYQNYKNKLVNELSLISGKSSDIISSYERIHALLFGAVIIDVEKTAKYLKSKFKIDFSEIENDQHTIFMFTFNNVRCGNNIEGYIKYKKIEITLNVERKITSVNFEIVNNLIMKVSDNDRWGFYTHPHISNSGSICYGNMNDVVQDLLNKRPENWIEFYASILYQVITTYNPDTPFSSITRIMQNLNRVLKIWGRLSTGTVVERNNYIYNLLTGRGDSSSYPEEIGNGISAPSQHANLELDTEVFERDVVISEDNE